MKKLLVAALLISVGGLAWRAAHRPSSEPKLLFDRFWVDRLPRDPGEEFHALIVHGEHPMGHFQTRTAWTGRWEGFHYHLSARENNALTALFPASKQQEKITWTVRRCNEQGFDLCLELTGASRGTRYFSKQEWGSRTDVDPTAQP
jgi:hypothetical protein